MGEGDSSERLIAVHIDESSLGASSAEGEHEREIAIYDLLAENRFGTLKGDPGPYRLTLALIQNKLVFDVRDEADRPIVTHLLAVGPFRQILSEYRRICARHYAAIKSASPSQIEAIDMGRRGMHNDAARLLMERLEGKIEMDFPTARRLFTLIVALHWEL
ncbi:UPF0262 protein [Terrihabitans soli]|uniref:UPF0262 protein IZ6_26090 n=1 Tax=Terrihabitans soli TaxID=708113 RepID=A0A6S6QMZ9_9HYPH|nr:UPF0262 family protein [Terrihabitans soli]BCJ91874.1 UPF0262 protein [Terrihabitans soli]